MWNRKNYFFVILCVLFCFISCNTPTPTDEDYFNIRLPSSSKYRGKRVAILGDSISTHVYKDGTPANVPEIAITEKDVGVTLTATIKYSDVYDESNELPEEIILTIGGKSFSAENIGETVFFTPGIEDIGKTVGTPRTYYTKDGVRNKSDRKGYFKKWWMYLQESYLLKIIPVCYSGSGIAKGDEFSITKVSSEAYHDSQIASCGLRIPGSMERIPPDVVIIQRMSNDLLHDRYVTENFFENNDCSSITSGQTVNELGEVVEGFIESYVLTINKLRQVYPDVKIILCTMYKETDKPKKYNDAVRQIAQEMDCGIIDFERIAYRKDYFWAGDRHPKAVGQFVLGKTAYENFSKEMEKFNK